MASEWQQDGWMRAARLAFCANENHHPRSQCGHHASGGGDYSEGTIEGRMRSHSLIDLRGQGLIDFVALFYLRADAMLARSLIISIIECNIRWWICAGVPGLH